MTSPLPKPPRPFTELSASGLLWWINRIAFHPHGYALGLHVDDQGNPTGWSLQGDGSEPWSFTESDETVCFDAARATLAAQTAIGGNR